MALTTISDLKASLNIGARPNLFEVEITLPSIPTVTFSDKLKRNVNYLCKGAAIPAYTIGIIEVPFRGERIKVPGDRVFTDWTVTFVIDSAHEVRDAFKQWTESIAPQFNSSATERQKLLSDYYKDIVIKHYDTTGGGTNSTPIRFYKLFDAFPTDVGPIELASDATDSLSEFTVSFQYHYLKSGANETAVT